MPSICAAQREALSELMDATAAVFLPVVLDEELPDLQLQMARAMTKCEMALPLVFNTMANHAFLEVFLPVRGRIARGGTPCPPAHGCLREVQ